MSVAVAVGVFDGVHLGHRLLLERTRERAAGSHPQEGSGRPVAVSFEPHPAIVLAKEFRPEAPLTPLPEKHARVAALGVELHVLPFTRELAALEPQEFVSRFLMDPFAPEWLVVGEDFALGKGRSGTVGRLEELGRHLGYQVDALPLCMIDGAPVTSSRIRALLASGDVAAAARLLGRRYGFTALVVGGDRIGRTLGFPTANLRLHDEQQIPANGVYAVWAKLEGENGWRMGAMSVGVRPTFGGGRRTLEVHLLDWDGDLYGKNLTVAFAEWLRPEQQFAGPQALAAAIAGDVAHARELLGASAPPGAERPGA